MELKYGTTSWHEKSWVGAFYAPKSPPKEWLTQYAAHFPAVEVDSTYYGPPRPSVVDGWKDRTPDGFVFAAKFPRTIVHGGEAAMPAASVLVPGNPVAEEDRDTFLEVMGRLGPRCGPLILQFPWFSKNHFSSVEPFLDRLNAYLEALPREFRYAVEVRNDGWVQPRLLSVLRGHRVACVVTELPNLRHPLDLWMEQDILTTDFLYGRLIGNRQEMDRLTEKRFDKIVVDRGPRLDLWAELLATAWDRVAQGFLFANNHYAGHGPATIRDVVRRVQARRNPELGGRTS